MSVFLARWMCGLLFVKLYTVLLTIGILHTNLHAYSEAGILLLRN